MLATRPGHFYHVALSLTMPCRVQARRTVPYAFNPALNSFGDGMGVPIFVRPDCPPEEAFSANAAPKKEKRGKGGAQNARPQFRSALEQVWLNAHYCCITTIL